MDENVETMIKNGDLLLQKEKVMDAIREYTRAFEAIGNNENEDTADLSYRLSQAYNSLESKNDENSKKYAEISLRIHQKTGDKDLEILDYLNLGYIEMYAKKRDESERYFKQAFDMAKSIDDPFLVSTALNAVAELKSESAKERKEAMEIYEQVLKISKDTEDWENYFEAMRGKIGLIR
ncbi:MAG: tetratricopeptide repeat protein, partial [Thermoplasmatales archaeon]|nr:tetratricopeptide repeat protein [Thermoplasmatales archaeon]